MVTSSVGPKTPPLEREAFGFTRDSRIIGRVLGYVPLFGSIVGIGRILRHVSDYRHDRVTKGTMIRMVSRGAIEALPVVGLCVLLPTDIIVTAVKHCCQPSSWSTRIEKGTTTLSEAQQQIEEMEDVQSAGNELYKLGVFYGKKKQYKKAFDLYIQAASKGNAKACFAVDVAYETGRGTPKNLGRAIEHYKAAADQGDVKAMSRLAGIYAKDGPHQDLDEAIRLYRAAVAHGNVKAKGRLADLYSQQGPHSDLDRANALYKEAAAEKDPHALFVFGEWYSDEGKDALATKYYRKAAEHRSVEAKKALKELESQELEDE